MSFQRKLESRGLYVNTKVLLIVTLSAAKGLGAVGAIRAMPAHPQIIRRFAPQNDI